MGGREGNCGLLIRTRPFPAESLQNSAERALAACRYEWTYLGRRFANRENGRSKTVADFVLLLPPQLSAGIRSKDVSVDEEAARLHGVLVSRYRKRI